MRMPRFRFTVRRMMAAVAVVGMMLGAVAHGVRLKRLRDGYLDTATRHSRVEVVIRQS